MIGTPSPESNAEREAVRQRMSLVTETHRCPYCEGRLKKWKVPDSIWNEWPNDYFYICFNDACPYFTRGWSVMAKQGAIGSYRLRFNPLNRCCDPIPVLSPSDLRDGIIEGC